jgi:hypothetical protein
MRILRPTLVLLLVLVACGREGERATPAPDATDVARPSRVATSPSPTASAAAAGATRAPAAAPAGCRNSTEASCGPFRFDPDVDDERMRVSVTASSRSVKVGDTVTFTISANDKDSSRIDLGTYRFGKDSSSVIAKGSDTTCPRAYGPWDPPGASAGSLRRTLRHTYRTAGEHEAIFTVFARSYSSGDHPWPARPPGDDDGECIDPYASSGKAEVTVTVSAS